MPHTLSFQPNKGTQRIAYGVHNGKYSEIPFLSEIHQDIPFLSVHVDKVPGFGQKTLVSSSITVIYSVSAATANRRVLLIREFLRSYRIECMRAKNSPFSFKKGVKISPQAPGFLIQLRLTRFAGSTKPHSRSTLVWPNLFAFVSESGREKRGENIKTGKIKNTS